MKPHRFILLLTLACGCPQPHCPAQSTAPPPLSGQWKKLHLTPEFWAEGACAGDVNRDGHTDILCGPFWHEGPAFKERHEIHPATAQFTLMRPGGKEETIRGFKGVLSGENGYSDNFLSYCSDVNGDGWVDYLVIGFPGTETCWHQNPQGEKRPWKRHRALEHTDNESPQFADVTGDGTAELVCMSRGTLGFAKPDPKRPEEPWVWHPAARNGRWQWNTHGLGYGDVNGDGRVDLLTAHNWWEQPASLEGQPAWKQHDAVFNNGGSRMFACDVNGDGLPDVITAWEAHGYGLYWYEQTKSEGAERWKRHVIMGRTAAEGETGVVFSQLHAMDLADINGDGMMDIITGKRIWAHGPADDADPQAPAVLYWFELRRDQGKARYIAHLIDDDSGVGTQVTAVDVNRDGRPDIVAGNKKGLFVHLQQ